MKTWVEINKENLLHNLSQFRKLVGEKVKIMGVVKANAYGHGLVEVAGAISDKADWLGVDSLSEALKLRQVAVKKPILVLGYTELKDLKEAVKNNVSLTVYNKETIEKLGKIPIHNPNLNPKIHIKIETGTSRQGVPEDKILEFIRFVKQYPSIEVQGISTHYANIEDTTDSSFAKAQLETFSRVAEILKKEGVTPLRHTACSAATILFPETRFEMVRLGISMYGLWSSKETKAVAKNKNLDLDLKPVLTWKTIVAQIKNLPAGTSVGYGLTERVSRDSKIAILPVGYFDGYDRKLSSVGNVLIRGKRCKVLGRVCMDMIIVDVTDLSKIELEDEVVLLGRQGKEEISAEDLAQKIGTINYEVVTRINPLIPRITP
ncbi:alanine racemase [Candidatus Falkowbacteria bacterium]|nr:alanine racemase [Candidatus Falkowbacteria bacterium]